MTRRRKFSFYALFLACYTVVHLRFEWAFWMEDDTAVFAKYAQSASEQSWLAVAKKVYFTKATWMIALVWLCALRMRFSEALGYSYLLYAIELMLLFPFNIYNGLNLLLALLFAAEQVHWRRRGIEA